MSSVQRGADWVKTATPEQIVAAQLASELITYMGGKTVDERAHDAHVADAPDRAVAQAYGLTAGQLKGNRDLDSTWFAAKRANLDPDQQAKLSWVETAPAADVYAAEQAGELDHLTGRDVTNEATRLDAIRTKVTAAMTANITP